MTKLLVAVTDSPFPNLDPATQVLSELNAELKLAKGTTPEDILAIAREADGLLVTYAKVPAQVIEQLKRCKVIARFGIGVDSVDIDAATRAGIIVTNVPEYCEDEVSDHAMALLLSLIRKIPFANKKTHAGVWSMPAVVPIHRLRGSVLGLAGFGKIPRLVAVKAQAFGLQVQTYDPYVSSETAAKLGVKLVSLPELLNTSDYISIHAPLTPETDRMFNADAFRQMKRSALLVNTARGPLVDVEALVDALDNKAHRRCGPRRAAAGTAAAEFSPARARRCDPDAAHEFLFRRVAGRTSDEGRTAGCSGSQREGAPLSDQPEGAPGKKIIKPLSNRRSNPA